jgi:class 3 adenylate cyclase
MISAGAQITADLLADLESRLVHAAFHGHLEEVRRLVENGILADAVDNTGKTALHAASENGHGDVVDFLMSKGANVPIQDKANNDSIDLATRGNHEHVARALRDENRRDAKKKLSLSSNNAANFALMEAFPHTIAAAMLEGREPEPIKRCSVSLLFSDMCGFTAMSSHMDPSKLSSLINRVFRKFDRLAHLHCVQKVNTVGDAYIAATNLLEDQPDDHAARLARFACDMLAAARTTLIDEEDPAGGCVSIRVGLHCGPVEGFVVGAHSGRYTLMGEAVNVAAAMEQSGAAGRAQCSAAFAELVGAQGHAVTLHRR